MERGVGDDLARTLVYLSAGEEHRADDRERDDDRFEHDRARDPANHRTTRILLRFGREELLVHRLIAQHEQERRQKELEGLDQREISQYLEVRSGQGMSDAAPAPGVMQYEEEAPG